MKQYLELLQAIKEQGTYKPAARENMPGTQSLFGYQFKHDLSEGFPLLTTKKMYWKGVVVELLWFLRGDANIKYLIDNGVNIWNEDAYQYYKKIACKNDSDLNVNSIYVPVSNSKNIRWSNEQDTEAYSMFTFEEFIDKIKNSNSENLPKYNDYTFGDCGYQYGKVWRNWEKIIPSTFPDPAPYKYNNVDQIKNVLTSLKNNPESRRHIITAVDPAHDNDLALYWCHALFQFNCRPLTQYEKYCKLSELGVDVIQRDVEQFYKERNLPQYYLDCQLYQRSADVVLGVPFNIASYSLLIHIFAKICNMIPGEFIHTFGDVHIYDTHKEAVEEQLTRIPSKLPTLKLGHFGLNIDEVNCWDLSDFVIENYNPQNKIKAELSTGLVK